MVAVGVSLENRALLQSDWFAEALIDWYHGVARDLPWRHTHEAYKIWLSEAMLQQTQVATVIPYYHRFLDAFPTVEALAHAPQDRVLKLWEGLGYYARARNLHKAAQLIVHVLGGQFPETLEGMNALPGVGRSTAGAIMSFVYGARTPILDGNVKRVLARWLDEPESVEMPEVTQRFWQVSQSLVEAASDPGILNQSLMELGATLCLPKQPRCLVCPVIDHCRAFQHGTQHERPVVKKRAPTPHYQIGAGILQDDMGRVLIQQRPQSGLLGGLWEFPGGKQQDEESLEDTVQRELLEELGVTVQVGEKITQVKHAYTHFRITLHAYGCRLISGEPQPLAADHVRWVTIDELAGFAFPKANHAILKQLIERA